MRLIDADALKDALVNAHINREITFDIAQFRCVMDTIYNAPTVSPYKAIHDELHKGEEE